MGPPSRSDWILRAVCFCLGVSLSTAVKRRLQTVDAIDLALMNEPDRPYDTKKSLPPFVSPRLTSSPAVIISTTSMPSLAPVTAPSSIPSRSPSQGPTFSTESPTFSPTSFPTRGSVSSTGSDGDDLGSEAPTASPLRSADLGSGAPTVAPNLNSPDGDDTAVEAPTVAPTRRNIFNNPDGDDTSVEAPTLMPSLSPSTSAFPTFTQGWEQVQNDFLWGRYDGEAFGATLSLTDDGNVITVGAHLYNESNSNGGRISRYDLRLNGVTTDLFGEEDAFLGYQQAVSADGNLIATVDQLTGWINVYEYTALDFKNATIIEVDLFPPSAAIALSGDGDLVAVVGEVLYNVTQEVEVVVKLYGLHNESDAYFQLGDSVMFHVNSMFDEDDEATWGLYDIAVDDDGKFVVVSQIGQRGFRGEVRTYRIDGIQLVQVGETFVSASEDDLFGQDVKVVVTPDSQVVAAFSAPGTDVVYVYTLDTTDEWQPLGSPILPERLVGSARSLFGYSIDVKQASPGEKLRIAIGAPSFDNGSGAMSLFQFSKGDWSLVGLPVVGPQASLFGETVACNRDCTLLAIGAPEDCFIDDVCGGGVYVVRYTYTE